MLWFLKIFSPKNSAKKLAFFTQSKAKFWKILIITLVFKKNVNFFAESCQKSSKIVIITSVPDSANFRPLGNILGKFFLKIADVCSPHFCAVFLCVSVDKNVCGYLFRRLFLKLVWSPCWQYLPQWHLWFYGTIWSVKKYIQKCIIYFFTQGQTRTLHLKLRYTRVARWFILKPKIPF
jgi:hypothetical protein